MPTISLRTVYQMPNDLSGMGELVALDLGTGSARFDPNLDRYVISATQIVFRGRCNSCTAAEGRRRPAPVH